MPVWNPYLLKDIKKKLERFAVEVCLKRWNTSLIDHLNASALMESTVPRKFLSLMYFCKLSHGYFVALISEILP